MNRTVRGVRLRSRERAYVNHRLALFLRSGVPIVTALTYIGGGAPRTSVRTMFSGITEQVGNGTSLAAALQEYRPAFTSFDIALIKIGEMTGRLHESLTYAAELIERERALKAKVIGALIYPVLVLFATLGIVLFLLLYAFPKILPLFKSFGGTLPLSTQILIAISSTFTHYGIWIVSGIAVLVAILIWLERHPPVRLLRHYLEVRTPVIGSMLRAYHIAVITKVLGTIVKSGIGLVLALELAEAATPNTAYREALRTARTTILRGKRLNEAFERYPTLFPSLVVQILYTGELTGNLGESLLQIADIYDEEVTERSQYLTTLIEPVLMIVTGLIVGFIALSIIAPIYKVTQDIGIS